MYMHEGSFLFWDRTCLLSSLVKDLLFCFVFYLDNGNL